MRGMPKVSVIVPVYNVEKYLDECMKSICAQTLSDIEIICVNDGSTDRSLEILERYQKADSRIQIISQENKGLSAARNVGFKAACGEYVFFVDSDDWIEPETLLETTALADEKQLDMLLFESCVFYDGLGEAYTKQGNYQARSRGYEYVASGPEMFLAMRQNGDYRVLAYLQIIRRDFLRENNLRFYEGIVHEDLLFSVQTMLEAKAVSHVYKAYYHRRMRPGSIVTSVSKYEACACLHITSRELIGYLLNRRLDQPVEESAWNRVVEIQRQAMKRYLDMSKEDAERFRWTDDQMTRVLFELCGYRERRKIQEEKALLQKEKERQEKQAAEETAGLHNALREACIQRDDAAAKCECLLEAQEKLNAEISAAQIENERLLADAACAQLDNQRLMHENEQLKEAGKAAERHNLQLEREKAECEGELQRIKSMPVIWTWLKICGGIRCLKENGIHYTVRHAFRKWKRFRLDRVHSKVK